MAGLICEFKDIREINRYHDLKIAYVAHKDYMESSCKL